MEQIRVMPLRAFSKREWRRDVIIDDVGTTAQFLRIWGRNKRGTAEWFWQVTPLPYPLYKKIPTINIFYKIYGKISCINNKKNAIKQAESCLREYGFVLLENHHLSFL